MNITRDDIDKLSEIRKSLKDEKQKDFIKSLSSKLQAVLMTQQVNECLKEAASDRKYRDHIISSLKARAAGYGDEAAVSFIESFTDLLESLRD